jgi:hypothetical protein
LPEQATRRDRWAFATRFGPWVALAAAAAGVFLTWTSDGPVRLSGIQGPNNGWLVLIAAAFALGWTRAAARGSWLGVVGVLGAAIVMGWTAVENWLDSRAVLGARASFGLILVVVASVALAGTALVRGVELASGPRKA